MLKKDGNYIYYSIQALYVHEEEKKWHDIEDRTFKIKEIETIKSALNKDCMRELGVYGTYDYKIAAESCNIFNSKIDTFHYKENCDVDIEKFRIIKHHITQKTEVLSPTKY